MSEIITAEEMAAHYAPLLDLHGALKEVERLSAENERLREALTECGAVEIFPDGKGGHKVSAFFANYKAANPLFSLLTKYISDDRADLGDTE